MYCNIKKELIPFTAMKNIFVALLLFLFCCFDVSAQSEIEVKTTNELQRAILSAKPGDIILLDDGEFLGDAVNFAGKGTAEAPIVIKAKNRGKAIFSVPLKMEGEFLSIIGIGFRNLGSLEISGKNCKVLHCSWSDVKSGKWIRVLPGSAEIELAWNLFENKTNNRELERGCQLMQIVVRNENERHHVHHNLFRDIPEGKTGNGFETVQLITENNPFDPPGGHCNTIIEDNLFVRCNGESEIISIKSNGNLLRRNTFRASKGSLVLRHGDDNVVTGNFFFGDGEKGSGGVRLQGTGQIVANNYFQDLGLMGLGMMDGTPDDLYIRVERAEVLFNTFVNCKKNFVLGLNHSRHPNGTVPKDCRIAGNLFFYGNEDKPDNFIEWVQGDKPEDWTWEDNVAFGAPIDRDIPGIRYADPHLRFRQNNLALPTSQTPMAEYRMDVKEEIKVDLLGAKWKKRRTVGAIQYPGDSANRKFLSEKDVGPRKY
jgi:poly(beta-D-mannuronate) lyase